MAAASSATLAPPSRCSMSTTRACFVSAGRSFAGAAAACSGPDAEGFFDALWLRPPAALLAPLTLVLDLLFAMSLSFGSDAIGRRYRLNPAIGRSQRG